MSGFDVNLFRENLAKSPSFFLRELARLATNSQLERLKVAFNETDGTVSEVVKHFQGSSEKA